ncbi:MAG TPA: hypothetical protein VEQ63_09855, partial [Bryobacteraceae bacterium]|nr:hypothetical protein [Bryobacteraceae bacterium]
MLRTSLCIGLLALCALAADWPDFRGPAGNGHSVETGVPLTWSESDNVRWKATLPGRGWSTPIIVGGEVWLTTATDGDRSLRVLALDASSGKLKHNVE